MIGGTPRARATGTLLACTALFRSAGGGARGWFVTAGFVRPVRGDAVVGHLFHFTGTDLDFDRYAVHAEQRGVQRLVAVGLGDRDVVLETPWQWFVQIMYSAQYAVAGIDLVDDDPERVDIHDLVEGPTLAAHLLVDAIEVFLSATDLAFDTVDGQAVAQGFFGLVDDFLAVAPGALDGLVDPRRTHRRSEEHTSELQSLMRISYAVFCLK